jgi:hypothetical protein
MLLGRGGPGYAGYRRRRLGPNLSADGLRTALAGLLQRLGRKSPRHTLLRAVDVDRHLEVRNRRRALGKAILFDNARRRFSG